MTVSSGATCSSPFLNSFASTVSCAVGSDAASAPPAPQSSATAPGSERWRREGRACPSGAFWGGFLGQLSGAASWGSNERWRGLDALMGADLCHPQCRSRWPVCRRSAAPCFAARNRPPPPLRSGRASCPASGRSRRPSGRWGRSSLSRDAGILFLIMQRKMQAKNDIFFKIKKNYY